MPHTVSLSDATFVKLQQLAVPFTDTPESVVARLADDALGRRAAQPDTPARAGADQAIHLEPDRHDSLTHARLIAAAVDGKELHRPKWNNLLDHLHILGWERLGSFEALKRISGARIRTGRYEDDGFHYLPEADLSIQGLDANLAWDHSLGLARQLHVSIRVKFEWRDKEGAARPGQLAVMEWLPPSLAIA